jgi:indole-3-glycerol phosphate synthase
MSGDLLGAVVAAARKSADERERRTPLEDVERALADARRPNGDGFRQSLAAPGVRIIAECKRRSPSRGVLRADYDPVAIARGYEANGAAAISVLTEPTFFDGSLDHLAAVRAGVSLPLLRKDFIVTPYQIAEAALAGADAVLLIVAALEDEALRALLMCARDHGLAALVEVHDEEELARAVASGADIIGVNSRNLRTLAVDTGVLGRLGPQMPNGVMAVAESGLKTVDDLATCRAAGYHAFLMGERFMTVPDPGAALGELRRSAEAVLA